MKKLWFLDTHLRYFDTSIKIVNGNFYYIKKSTLFQTEIILSSNSSNRILSGVHEQIRTADLCLRRATLYPTELHEQFVSIIAHYSMIGKFLFYKNYRLSQIVNLIRL